MAPQQETGRLPTPFKRASSESNIELEHLLRLMPASRRSKTVFHFNDRKSCPMDIVQRPKADVEFLAEELCVPSLNDIHDLLWLAGRPMPPRPLTYQLTASRTIAVVEDINLHLIWEPGRIFLKPIPRFLLNAAFWTKHLASLIQHESDYRIAASNHLLPADVDWESWRQTSWELLENSPCNMTRVNKRYRYGELRLSRLNKISRWRSLTCSGDGLVGLMRGYKFGFATYGQLLEACLFPVVTATAYILLVLTAMQVGLSTDYLKDNFAFQQASWGFTVFSILAPLILIVLSFVLVFLYVVFNYRSTKAFNQRRMQFYDNLGRNGC
ncbi:uncharacterized protein G6M90_00g005850 [Metarhizium brunneum]|uniref:Subtilisin-like serine protease n=1 Tax=Metarhizium brunneum TaxID=500148 RepID=A0A7D5YXY6_9HYPO